MKYRAKVVMGIIGTLILLLSVYKALADYTVITIDEDTQIGQQQNILASNLEIQQQVTQEDNEKTLVNMKWVKWLLIGGIILLVTMLGAHLWLGLFIFQNLAFVVLTSLLLIAMLILMRII